jgi:hypothetical protein
MTKQEKIQEAYGDYWKIFKNDINQEGSISQGKIINSTHKDVYYEFVVKELDMVRNGTILTPKSLIGIKYNNFWIKIESEEDLPKEPEQYWVVLPTGTITKASYLSERKTFFIYGDIKATHYQKLNEPKPPIY